MLSAYFFSDFQDIRDVLNETPLDENILSLATNIKQTNKKMVTEREEGHQIEVKQYKINRILEEVTN